MSWPTRRPGFLWRIRAKRAQRAYDAAYQRYRSLDWELAALAAEREALLQTMAARQKAGEDMDLDAMLADLNRINARFFELAEPSREAREALAKAYARVQALLWAVGYQDEPEDDGEGDPS